MIQYRFSIWWKEPGLPDDSATELAIESTNPIDALAIGHATLQRMLGLKRDRYRIVKFKRPGLSEYDAPVSNPLVDDEFIERLPHNVRRKFNAPATATVSPGVPADGKV